MLLYKYIDYNRIDSLYSSGVAEEWIDEMYSSGVAEEWINIVY